MRARIVLHTRRADLAARTPNQRQYLRQMLAHDIIFGIGPAGTGKTFLAVACAVDALERSTVQRIVLTRPAVEAGERLGFLPGDLAQKVDPYLRPLYDALYDLMGFDRVTKAFEKGLIEIAPLAFMRGRTLNHAFVILDEAQNTTPEQMKMFLTRIGFGSRCVVTGDISQIDLPQGPRQRPGRGRGACCAGVDGIAFTHFTPADVVRHPLVARIVEAYDVARRARFRRLMALAARCALSLQMPDARHRAVLPRHRVRALDARRAAGAGRNHGAHRRRGRRPRAQPRLPRQGLRHQRADLRLRARPVVQADLVLCAPVVEREAAASRYRAAGALRASAGARHAACAGLRPRDLGCRRAGDGGARVELLLALGFADPYAR